MTDTPKPPTSLKSRGKKMWRALWRALPSEVEFSDVETAILTEICSILDTIDALELAVETEGVMVTGSQGQLVVNPAIGEKRQQQATLARLIPALHLDEEASATARKYTQRARSGAAARWMPPGLRAVN